MNPTSLAAVWNHMPDMPNAEQTSKGQESSARRDLENTTRKRGLNFDPQCVRPMTADELARTPTNPSPGVELRGLIYRIDAPNTQQVTIDDLLDTRQDTP